MSDAVLATQNLVKTFGALKATDDVSIDLRPGEIHAVIGPNGAGKSTLIQQICGGLKPDAGRVFLNGQDVSHHDTRARAQAGLGRTFQVSALCMEDTVLENAVLGAIGANRAVWRFWASALKTRELTDRAKAALERVGLSEHHQTRCGNLSHGERRQLEVGIALTLSPRAFIMDEPMAGLGAGGSKKLTELLDGMRAQAPILLVEHDMDAVFALADRISVLVYGKIIASGSIDDIKNSDVVREAYLGQEA
ncbi:ABC transporter ATP-binding protein [Yoonia sediminilitoris]|uniref:Amino acid/amide ABC transporter ATP-binding protein 1 (HAAT family) n=1 Tax=Yoonia sediminilitoris TaxID=1286148 RepID=A0A2T6K8P6_9RHOB|nr:ABC transporter ATP-binding protein [Yoonia sediminilitoris]PUB11092.1 amino acid/amide ABC transporter ATP-binding protein 1 (HAAT family) [Yoonia sediminilitoris]RCW91011.1 amino acid/amide ABC transporter ATP-binding protein 1 (HAAT family) [Yoonia sediminilitoris]